MNKPPSSNTGAENTAPIENRTLIDWLAWTVKVLDVHQAIKDCGLDFLDFKPSSGGGMGYRSTMRAGKIVVYYDGAENMGCHFSMSGDGCRYYEARSGKKHCFYQLLHHLQSISATFTRLDVAIDNVDGLLCLDKLRNDIESKSVRTRFKGGFEIKNFSFNQETKDCGRTIYVGSPSSRIKIRFYDKAAQLNTSGHWTRAEIQLMSERAQEFIFHLLKGKPLGQIAATVMNNYFTPIHFEELNKSRCSVKAWWAAWIQTTEKLQLSTSKAIKLVSEMMDYIKQQYAPSIALISKHLGSHTFKLFIDDLISNGKKRFNSKHDFILECSNLEPLPF